MGIARGSSLMLSLALLAGALRAGAQEEEEDMFANIGQVEEEEGEPLPGAAAPSPTDELVGKAKQAASSIATETGGVCVGGAPFKRIAISASKVVPSAQALVESLTSLQGGLGAMDDEKDRRALTMELGRALPAARAIHALTEAMVMADRGEARPGKAAGPPESAKGRYEALTKAHCPDTETAMCVPAKQELQKQFCDAAAQVSPLTSR